MNDAVAIILSTYNGVSYISEQMDSLIRQSYSNIEIYIHDDGSEDGTLEVVKSYSDKYANVHFVEGKFGQGYPECFISLLKEVRGYKYYAFSDQDDVWMPSKVNDAVECLSQADNTLPLLYYTAVDYCDKELNYIRSSRFAEGKTGICKLPLQSLLFGGEAMGMTFVFNDVAREALITANEHETFKDWFLKLYCAACGNVFYNAKSSAQYRRHEAAVTNGSNPSGKLHRYVGQIKDIFLKKDGFLTPKKTIKYLVQNRQEDILPKNKALLDLFAEPNTLLKRLRKCFWSKRFRTKMLDEIGYRVAFLLGRI